MIERLCIPLPVILVVLCYIVPVENPPLPVPDKCVSTCPTKITPREFNCLNNLIYHIVRNNESCRYIEGCFVLQWVPAGNATILDQLSGLINTVPCREGTFQRHPYKSNTQCACNETKGHCNETGQIVASNGSTTEDRTCRCDFRRGYKFSTKPPNECVCKSSSEDCTCIKEECKTGYIMSPDYKCVSENLCFTTNYTCKDYITSEKSTTESVPGSDISVSEESTTESVPDSNISVSEKNTTCSISGTILGPTVQFYVAVIIAALFGFAIGVVLDRTMMILGIPVYAIGAVLERKKKIYDKLVYAIGVVLDRTKKILGIPVYGTEYGSVEHTENGVATEMQLPLKVDTQD